MGLVAFPALLLCAWCVDVPSVGIRRALLSVAEEVVRVNGMFGRRDPLRCYMDILMDTLQEAGMFACTMDPLRCVLRCFNA